MFKRGFTLIEIMIVVGITALLGSTVLLSFSSYRQRQVLENSARTIVAVLRDAHQRAVNHEAGKEWGVHFEKGLGGGRDYYAFFSGPMYLSPAQLTFLPNPVIFTDPASGSKEVIFEKLTGLPSVAITVTIALISDSSISKTITVDSVGKVQY